ncbi:MAG: hypothetical protein IH936_16580 [Acidobacteria bacterium]|nr:hypothetical protein [Acidobacteriota bacterium]
MTGYLQSRRRLVNKAREIGATWLAVALIYWLWLSTPRFYALLGSRKEKLVDDRTPMSLFGKLRFIHETQPEWLRPKTEDVHMRFVNLENASTVVGEATNIGFGRSFRASVILTDEWAHVDRGKHPGDALRYGVGAVLRSRPRLRIEDLNLSKLPKGPAGEVAEVFERLLGPYLG